MAFTVPSQINFGPLQNQDLQQAQIRYQNYLNQSYTKEQQDFINAVKNRAKSMRLSQPEIDAAVSQATQQVEDNKAKEAEAIYLKPLQSKWDIINSNPTEFQDKSKLDKINSDFETATAQSVKALDKTTSAADVLGPRINPLISQWSAVGVKPSLTAAQQLQLRRLQSDIGKEETQQNRYETAATFFGINGEADKMKAAQDAADKQAQKIAGMKSAADALMLGTPKPAGQRLDSVTESGTTAPTIPSPDNIVGYTTPDATVPGGFLGLRQPPFVVGNGTEGIPAPQPSPEPAAAALTKKPLIFISGRPDLSRYGDNPITRAEADAAWSLAHPMSGVGPTPTKSSTESLIEVINPAGKRVRIKQGQLDDALRQGYQQP